MTYKYFSFDGDIKPADEAVVSLENVEYSYGYGVYETIRVNKGRVFFVEDHCQRLIESARILGLEHKFKSEFIKQSIDKLLQENQVETCNLKILLIGGKTRDDAHIYILCLNPLFPDRKLYKNGVHTITYKYEREFPHAKTLNMLSSYLAYRDAKTADAYDALLIDREGCVTEGTRTNFFTLKGKTIYSPPSNKILLGVTRSKVLEAAFQNGYSLIEQPIPLDSLHDYDAAFLTSTSSKIMPIKSVNQQQFNISDNLKKLMQIFDDFIKNA